MENLEITQLIFDVYCEIFKHLNLEILLILRATSKSMCTIVDNYFKSGIQVYNNIDGTMNEIFFNMDILIKSLPKSNFIINQNVSVNVCHYYDTINFNIADLLYKTCYNMKNIHINKYIIDNNYDEYSDNINNPTNNMVNKIQKHLEHFKFDIIISNINYTFIYPLYQIPLYASKMYHNTYMEYYLHNDLFKSQKAAIFFNENELKTFCETQSDAIYIALYDYNKNISLSLFDNMLNLKCIELTNIANFYGISNTLTHVDISFYRKTSNKNNLFNFDLKNIILPNLSHLKLENCKIININCASPKLKWLTIKCDNQISDYSKIPNLDYFAILSITESYRARLSKLNATIVKFVLININIHKLNIINTLNNCFNVKITNIHEIIIRNSFTNTHVLTIETINLNNVKISQDVKKRIAKLRLYKILDHNFDE